MDRSADGRRSDVGWWRTPSYVRNAVASAVRETSLPLARHFPSFARKRKDLVATETILGLSPWRPPPWLTAPRPLSFRSRRGKPDDVRTTSYPPSVKTIDRKNPHIHTMSAVPRLTPLSDLPPANYARIRRRIDHAAAAIMFCTSVTGTASSWRGRFFRKRRGWSIVPPTPSGVLAGRGLLAAPPRVSPNILEKWQPLLEFASPSILTPIFLIRLPSKFSDVRVCTCTTKQFSQ